MFRNLLKIAVATIVVAGAVGTSGAAAGEDGGLSSAAVQRNCEDSGGQEHDACRQRQYKTFTNR